MGIHQTTYKMNPNVRLTLMLVFFGAAADSMFGSSVFSAYIYIITNNSASKVGYISGLIGLVNLLSALVSGVLVDRSGRRDIILRAGAIVALVAIAGCLLPLLLAFDSESQYYYICAAWPVWGLVTGITNPARQALFADSIATGHREKLYTYRTVLDRLGSSVGPLISLGLFWYLGAEWTADQCRIVLVTGLALKLIPVCLLFGLSDDHSLTESSEGLGARKEAPTAAKAATGAEEAAAAASAPGGGVQIQDGVQDGARPSAPTRARSLLALGRGRELIDPLLIDPTKEALLPAGHAEGGLGGGTGEGGGEGEGEDEEGDLLCCSCCCTGCRRTPSAIPLAIVTADILAGLASGCAIKFFPIFFLHDLGAGPLQVSAIYAASPLCTAAAAVAARRLAQSNRRHLKRLGPVGVAVLFKTVGVALLTLIATLHWDRPPAPPAAAAATVPTALNATHGYLGGGGRHGDGYGHGYGDGYGDGGGDGHGHGSGYGYGYGYAAPPPPRHGGGTQLNRHGPRSYRYGSYRPLPPAAPPPQPPASTGWICAMAVAYIIRMALMNSTQGLVKSVLMDWVPKAKRGRYAALESVKSFNWSGSAVAGGLLVEWRGIRANFLATAGAAALGIVGLVYVRVLLARAEGAAARGGGCTRSNK
jgi:hypothetical protein